MSESRRMTTGAGYEAWTGEVRNPLVPSPRELLEELCGVVEAVAEKEHPLTRAGIPPKPLWAAVNERLHWRDPDGLLHDWDECDQIRLLFSMAWELRLIEKDEEGILRVGSGADSFFTSAPLVRARLLRRAWLDVLEWDERCDARDDEGYRHNFGRFFRRDFLRDSTELREVFLSCLSRAEPGTWHRGQDLGVAMTEEDSALLIPEDHSPPIVRPGKADPEIARLADYCLYLAARFGWVELGRLPDEELEGPQARLFRLTDFGAAVLGVVDGALDARPAEDRRPFVLDASRDITVFRAEADFGDEFVVRRVAEAPAASWVEPAATYRLSPDSVRSALENGLDPALFRRRVLDRSRTPVPDTIAVLFEDALRSQGRCSLIRGLTAVELPPDRVPELVGVLDEQGFSLVAGRLVLVPWSRWESFCELLGGEPSEGFRYPPDESLARIEGTTLHLEWEGLPVAGRDLLSALGLGAECDESDLDQETIRQLGEKGWTRQALAMTVASLTDGVLPRTLK